MDKLQLAIDALTRIKDGGLPHGHVGDGNHRMLVMCDIATEALKAIQVTQDSPGVLPIQGTDPRERTVARDSDGAVADIGAGLEPSAPGEKSSKEVAGACKKGCIGYCYCLQNAAKTGAGCPESPSDVTRLNDDRSRPREDEGEGNLANVHAPSPSPTQTIPVLKSDWDAFFERPYDAEKAKEWREWFRRRLEGCMVNRNDAYDAIDLNGLEDDVLDQLQEVHHAALKQAPADTALRTFVERLAQQHTRVEFENEDTEWDDVAATEAYETVIREARALLARPGDSKDG